MTEQENKQNNPAVAAFDYVEIFVFATIFVILLMTLCFRLCSVDGPSMNKTLANGENLVISNLFYTPKNGDIIVFHQTNDVRDGNSSLDRFNEPIVKRVIATGGQYVKLDFDTKKVYVSDDEIFEESDVILEDYAYFSSGQWYQNTQKTEYYVPEGYLFVMGDNRNNSADSRSAEVGLVDTRRVLGKVVLRITPFSSFGRVS